MCLSKSLKQPSHEKTVCIVKNKVADQFCSYFEADQHLCCRYTDSTIHFIFFLTQKVHGFKLL